MGPGSPESTGSEAPVADVTVVPVPTVRRAAYLAFSRRMAEVYRDHGATDVVDYWQAGSAAEQAEFHAATLAHEPDRLQGLAALAGAEASESVVVTVTTWPSREARDRGTAAATSDPRVLATLDEEPVFDGGRLAADVFEVATQVPDGGRRPDRRFSPTPE